MVMKSTLATESQSQPVTEYFPQHSWQRAVPTFLVTDVALTFMPSSKKYCGPSASPLFPEKLSKESAELLWEAIRRNQWASSWASSWAQVARTQAQSGLGEPCSSK